MATTLDRATPAPVGSVTVPINSAVACAITAPAESRPIDTMNRHRLEANMAFGNLTQWWEYNKKRSLSSRRRDEHSRQGYRLDARERVGAASRLLPTPPSRPGS